MLSVAENLKQPVENKSVALSISPSSHLFTQLPACGLLLYQSVTPKPLLYSSIMLGCSSPVKLTAHLPVVSKLKIYGSTALLLYVSSWHGA
jgi:hypothetical protein